MLRFGVGNPALSLGKMGGDELGHAEGADAVLAENLQKNNKIHQMHKTTKCLDQSYGFIDFLLHCSFLSAILNFPP